MNLQLYARSIRSRCFLVLFAGCSAAPAQDIATGLAAHYTFDGTPNDESGNGNNATPGGLYQYVSNGLSGSALRIIGDGRLIFAGGGHVLLPSFGAFMNGGFTVSVWARDEVSGVDAESYVSFGILDQPMFDISLGGTPSDSPDRARDLTFAMNAGSGSVGKVITKTLNGADLAKWKHLVLTYAPGKMAAYFNGSKIGEEFITVNVFPVTTAALGRHWWSGGAGSSTRMSVTLDNVRIYSRALAEPDVHHLYVTEALPPQPLPVITSHPAAQLVIERQSTSFRVAVASTTPLIYQWRKNGVPLPGAIESSYTIPAVTPSDSGIYSVSVSNPAGTTTSEGAALTIVATNPGQLTNISTLVNGGFTSGFVIAGSTPKSVLIRAVGPSLTGFGISSPASQLTLIVYSGTRIIASNSEWSTGSTASEIASASAATGAFALTPGSLDAAVLLTLAPGNYTAQVSANGPVLLEVYGVP